MTYDWDSFDFETIFKEDTEPKLLSIGEEGGDYTKHPRVMHTHDGRLEILLITQGNGVHMIDGATYYTAKGDLLIYNSGSLHEERADAEVGMNVFYCAVTGLAVEGLTDNCLVPQGFRPVVPCGDAYGEMESLFSLMFDHAGKAEERNTEFMSLLMKALLVKAYGMILNQPIEEGNKDWELGDAIKKYIDIHYLENMTLQSMAEDMNINQYYLAHVFKSTTGYSPIQYVIRRRLGEAQSYLMNTDMSLSEIAEAVGYNNINHFHNSFTKYVGISPGKYRKNFGTQHT
jgi:AraC-like DNA-binding protein